MSDLQAAYESILEANNVHEPVCNRKTLKQLIQILIPEVEFHRPRKTNESPRLSIKKTRDASINIHLVEQERTDGPRQMKVLFEAPLLLRKAINSCTKWVFLGSFD